MKIKGKAFKFGDNIDTDVIIPARYLNTSVPEELAPHCMEDIDSDFSGKVSPGDIIVGGSNFGCGSSREHAPIAIKAVGISCVVARSFARIFFRNAINTGLPILQVDEADEIETGDQLEVDLAEGTLYNKTKDKRYKVEPAPEFLQGIFKAGGLIEYVRQAG